MKIDSYAKLNLGLVVVGRREDGYHDIQSVFQEVDLADRITISNSESLSVTSDDPSVPDGEENLVYRAAAALRDALRRPELSANIKIEKHIPAGGGLGGGSSNAASSMHALTSFWDLDLQRARMAKIGETIGADVPFFMTGGTACVSGKGDIVQPIDCEGDVSFVLVDPGYRVATPWAFGKLNMKLTIDSPYIRFLNSARGSGKVDIYELFGLIKNDFLPVVEARYPSTERILSVLRGGGAKVASMSGTGSTLYGGFALESDALSTIEHLRSLGYPARFCRPVRRQVQ